MLETALAQADLHAHIGQWAKAETIYRDILRAHPDHAVTLNNLGRALQNQGSLDQAAEIFKRLIGSHPDLALAYWNLGIVLCESGKLEQSFAAFRRHAELARPDQTAPKLLPHKIRHDEEQRLWLADKGKDGVQVFNGGDRVAGRAVAADASAGKVASEWKNNRPQIVVIDHLLSPEALDGLRAYCHGSTIWNTTYDNGYLGATPGDGLGCPLLAQIAEELRTAYPDILRDLPLLQFWAFKYDSALSGISLHADFAAVNINFWITPDDANRDPAGGGLVIWDTPAPLDWDFSTYNDNPAAARAFLTQSGARKITVPYRCNRAVVFDSSLFHETDKILFKEGYENRRLNFTFLYGRREGS